jgi:SAM-dependent MidA family methyltransferase
LPSAAAELGGLQARIAERARREGSLRFDAFIEAALYDADGGFYVGGGPGRRRDFLTSPEVGPLFGTVLARALDEWWAGLGRPDPFVLVEAGAGPGTLAVAVLAAAPACARALRYVLVERSTELRARHADHLPVEPAGWVLGPLTGDEEDRHREPGRGPLVASLAELPAARFVGVVLANELLDNLPFRLLERAERGWCEVRVGADDDESDGLGEVLVGAPDDDAALATRLAPEAPPGGRIPLQQEAARWLGGALGLLDRGQVVVFDYGDSTASLAARPWQEWVRTYRGHRRGGHPLGDPGSQDVTCEVAVDQLGRTRPVVRDRSQADFLAAFGIDELVEEGRRTWTERAAVGDLDAMRARSRITEAEALTDPAGLGAFRVLEWEV